MGIQPDDSHSTQRRRIQTALDQPLGEEDQSELKQHLLVCADCRAYAKDLAVLEEQLGMCLQSCWPGPGVQVKNLESMQEGMGENVGKTRRQRRISRLIKEVSLVVAAIILVVAVSSIGNLTAAGPVPTSPTTNPQSAAEAGNQTDTNTDPIPTRAPRFRRRFPSTVPYLPGARLNELQAGPRTSQILNFPPLKENWSPIRVEPDINMSGPVNLHLLLHYWSEQGNPEIYLQPNNRDETVMFYEMVNFIEDHTRLSAIMRMGGDIQTIKDLIAAGIPVMVEKGFDGPPSDGWAGHYVVVDGYDDATSSVVLLEAFPEDGGDTRMSYREFEQNWRAFNYSYLVVYPPEQESKVKEALGGQVDEFQNYQFAADKADTDIKTLTSARDLFFAWFNKGTSLTYLQDFHGAKDAYDQAFSIYQPLPPQEQPWRMLWYQTRPYWAYFYTGSYQEVIDLATKTLNTEQKPVLEESFYWRALAKEALGDVEGAIQDLNKAIQLNPNFIAGKYQLRRIKGES